MNSVILITPGFTADEQDQNCLPTLQLYAVELKRQGIDVCIVALDYPFTTQPYTWKGIPVYPCGGRNKRWLKPLVVWRAMNICHQLLDSKPKAVVHSFWLSWACAIGERIASRRGARHITTLMGQDALPQNRRWFRFLKPERQDDIVVLSKFQQQALAQNAGFTAQQVIPWGVQQAEFPAPKNDARPVDILGVGSLIPLKNWDLWLSVVALVKQTNPGLQAVLIGSGPEKQRLAARIKALNLEDCVSLTDELPRPEVLSKMQQAKVLLHTSNYESQGYVLLEAAAAGCRLVSTPVGIAPEVAQCAETPEALGGLLLEVLATGPQKTPSAPYTMEQTAQAYLKWYQG